MVLWHPNLVSRQTLKLTNIQSIQSITLCLLTAAPSSVSNYTLPSYSQVNTISKTASTFYRRFRSRLANSFIRELNTINIPGNPARRIACRWCRDSVNP